MTKANSLKIVLGFVKLQQKKWSLIWSALGKPSCKLRRASMMPPLQEARIK